MRSHLTYSCQSYVDQVRKILKKDGFLNIKCKKYVDEKVVKKKLKKTSQRSGNRKCWEQQCGRIQNPQHHHLTIVVGTPWSEGTVPTSLCSLHAQISSCPSRAQKRPCATFYLGREMNKYRHHNDTFNIRKKHSFVWFVFFFFV